MSTTTHASISDLLTTLKIEPKPWIDGRWHGTDQTIEVIDPAIGESISDVHLASGPDFQMAIDGAAAALPLWKSTSAVKRGAILKRIARALTDQRESLAALLVREQGKPFAQASAEVDYSASFFEWFGELARRHAGRRMPHPEDNREFLIEKIPAGVAGLITPWNFPLAQGAKKAAAALAAGCTAVWKPSELTPLIALAMGPLTQQCDLPDGILQILPARGPIAGEALADDDRVAVVSVTGSVPTGQAVYAAGAKHLQRVTLELGGNAPIIILDDADLDLAAEHLVKLKLFVSGQVCVTANRVYVPKSLEDQFCEKVRDRVMRARIGNGLGEQVDAGPLIHREACERVTKFIDDAVNRGAQVVCENHSYEDESPTESASFHSAVVLRNVPEEATVCCEEVFGPVVSLLSYETVPEVIHRANNTRYGLAGYVYGRDLTKLRAVAADLEVGIVGVNEWRPLKAEVPFGGVKMSGIGAEGGEEGLEEFLETRVISMPVGAVD